MNNTSQIDLNFTTFTSLTTQTQAHCMIISPLFKLLLSQYFKMKTTLITPITALLLAYMTVASPSHSMIFDCVNDGLGGILFSGPSLSLYSVSIQVN